MSNLRQQNIPAEDLSDLSAPAPRGAGLGDLLSGTPAPARREPLPQADSDTVERVLEAPAPARPKAPARPPRQASPRTRSKPTSAVYVSQGVKLRFEDYRHKAKKTNLQVVLEAITAKHGQLADIIKASAVSTAPVGGSLFPADPSAVRYLGGGAVQIGFSPTPEQESVLDALGEELGFSTRSTWIAPILNAFLPGRKDG
ncbi:hypothetical protein [Mycolicibacterium llatzerense]|uniref:hypothetical protein n=1 Tax=Mycolicibacterium llatzerense TaxID=280871 RepID=UPI0031E1EFAF